MDGKDLTFQMGNTLDEVKAKLSGADISYDITDDTSSVRNWAGYTLRTRLYQLTFDLDKKLHEIVFGEDVETNLPIKIGDTVTQMTAALGEKDPVDCPEFPAGPVSTLCCEYAMDGCYIRPVFGGDRTEKEYHLWEIIISQYSMEQYADTSDTARLVFTNEAKEQAELFIGMPEKDAQDALKSLGIHYSDSYDMIFGEVVLGQPSTPDDDAVEGYCFQIFFSFGRVQTIDILGSGVYTEKGLCAQDPFSNPVPKERMTALYGEEYFEWPIQYEDSHIYGYISGSNYLFVRVSTFTENGQPAEAVTGFFVTRYSNTRAFD